MPVAQDAGAECMMMSWPASSSVLRRAHALDVVGRGVHVAAVIPQGIADQLAGLGKGAADGEIELFLDGVDDLSEKWMSTDTFG
jgi:hypothetical protein